MLNFSSIVKTIFGTLFRGLLLGAGFALGFGILYATTFPSISADVDQQINELKAQDHISPKDIRLSDLQEQHQGETVSITGKAENIGKRTATEVMLQADLFKQGRFVDQCSGRVSGPLGQSETRNFKICCGSCGKPPAEHDSFKVSVLGSVWP